MTKVRRVNVRAFSRRMYDYIDDLPIAVVNARNGKVMFIVTPYKEGEYDIRAEDTV